MIQTIKRTILALAVITLLAAPAIVSAHDESGSGSSGNSGSGKPTTDPGTTTRSTTAKSEKARYLEQQLKERLEQQKQQRQAAVEDKKAEVRQKLDAAKKRVCENHQSRINKLMTDMNTRRQNAFDRITQIYEAVQDYHSTHNLSATNYDDLIITAEAAKAVALAAKDTQKSAQKLNCNGESPKADMADFKTKRADSIDAIKAYRDAVKALVQAVRTAAEATEGVS